MKKTIKKKITGSWHCHHEVLCELDTEPRENRIAYIKAEKPEHEQELRLRLYRPMSAKAVKMLIDFNKVCAAAWAEYNKVCAAARAEYGKICAAAGAKYDKVCNERIESLEAIHKIECPDCPWDGKTIFSGAKNEPQHVTPLRFRN